MNLKNLTRILCILFLLSSCKETKKTSTSSAPAESPAPKDSQQPAGVPTSTAPADEPLIGDESGAKTSGDSLMRFIVSFYSIGSGSESEQMVNLKTHIASFEKKIAKRISYSQAPWGREGEVDYCFSLNDLTGQQQTDFIKGAKEVLAKAQWVHYFENKACRK